MFHYILLISTAFDILIIFLHITALTLLLKMKNNNIKGSQKSLLISLCLSEVIYAIIDIGTNLTEYYQNFDLSNHLWMFTLTSYLFLYFIIMILNTLDRFMEIYLNIKYFLYWSNKKTIILLIIILIVLSFIIYTSAFIRWK